MNALLRGIILGLSITAPIGPTNAEVIRRGFKDGWKSSSLFCAGVLVALVIYLSLVGFGFSYLADSRGFNIVMLSFGVIVLAYLSCNALRDFFHSGGLEFDKNGRSTRHFLSGIGLTISNPAVLLLWTGIMGADLSSSRESLEDGITLSLGILIGVVVFFTALNALIHFGRQFIKRKYLRFVSLGAGFILLFFTVKFAVDLFKIIL